MGLRVTIPPAVEPVSLEEAKAHLHYDAADQDDRIAALIMVAREACEIETNRALTSQTLALTLDEFPDGRETILLPRPPLVDVLSIAYTDTAGQTQALGDDEFQIDAVAEPGRVAPARGLTWPQTDEQTLGAVVISYTAGWSDAASVPAEIRQAMLLLIGHWFEHLEAVTLEGQPAQMPFAVRMLLTHCKVPFFA